MTIQLTSTDLEETKKLLKDYDPAKQALSILEENDGFLETSFEELWKEKNPAVKHDIGKLWEITKKKIREEICGDKGFRNRVEEYNQKKGSADAAPLLIGAIVHLVNTVNFPIDPGIATIIVLYILKIGLDIFCEYTKPISETE